MDAIDQVIELAVKDQITALIACENFERMNLCSQEFFDRIPQDRLSRWARSRQEVILDNGSRIRFMVGSDPNKVRGMELNLLVIDGSVSPEFCEKAEWSLRKPPMTTLRLYR